jgi:hypothetical protein
VRYPTIPPKTAVIMLGGEKCELARDGSRAEQESSVEFFLTWRDLHNSPSRWSTVAVEGVRLNTAGRARTYACDTYILGKEKSHYPAIGI